MRAVSRSARRRSPTPATGTAEAIPLRDALALRPIVADLESALRNGDVREVESCCNELSYEICMDLGLPILRVTVRDERPEQAGYELHGLYEWADGKIPQVQVWMRTRARGRIVAFRTFLRTLLHELVHHVDFGGRHLDVSPHGPAFYRRESSLFRQLAPDEVVSPPS